MKDIKICAAVATGFWRCGVHFSHEGKFVSLDDFTGEQWDILKAEPMLRISEATEAEVEAANPPNELHARITEVVSTLAKDDFGQDGKPKVDALRERLGDEFGKITASDRDAAWDALKANGFELPSDD